MVNSKICAMPDFSHFDLHGQVVLHPKKHAVLLASGP